MEANFIDPNIFHLTKESPNEAKTGSKVSIKKPRKFGKRNKYAEYVYFSVFRFADVIICACQW